jgi:hypothetical protein
MKNQLRFVTFVVAGALALVGVTGTADAGRGGSAERIMNAKATGSVDAIIAEVERAERLTCDRCVPVVMDLLDDDRYEVREVAGWWFARRAKLKVELAARATTDLAGSDSRLARNGADLLGAFMHPGAVSALTAAAGRTSLSADARLAAVRALGMIGHPAGRAGVTTGLGDADASVRLTALDAWPRLRDVSDAAPVVALLTDADARVRAAAAGVIGGERDRSGPRWPRGRAGRRRRRQRPPQRRLGARPARRRRVARRADRRDHRPVAAGALDGEGGPDRAPVIGRRSRHLVARRTRGVSAFSVSRRSSSTTPVGLPGVD